MYSTTDEEPDDLSLSLSFFFILFLEAQNGLQWVYWGGGKELSSVFLVAPKQLENNSLLQELCQLLRPMPLKGHLSCSPYLHYLNTHQFPTL